MLWTMAEPLLATQLGTAPKPVGNASTHFAPHGAWRCAGNDDWISIVVRSDAEWRSLCAMVPGLSGLAALDLGQRIEARDKIGTTLAAWCAPQPATAIAAALLTAGIPAAALARTGDLANSPHLAARAFWEGGLPGLPWRASFGRARGPAPGLGEDIDRVLADVLGLSLERIAGLRASGAFGPC
jgi:crotonobetainyl-CoA:carnitine CoA-transferase CaiB-like acyl-CoA transferase